MKKNVFLITAIILVSLSVLYAKTIISSDKDGVAYHCDSLKTNTTMSQVTLLGNVSFKTKNLSIANCTKIDWDLNRKKITAYNVKYFNFNGHLVLASEPKISGTLEYVINDTNMYIK